MTKTLEQLEAIAYRLGITSIDFPKPLEENIWKSIKPWSPRIDIVLLDKALNQLSYTLNVATEIIKSGDQIKILAKDHPTFHINFSGIIYAIKYSFSNKAYVVSSNHIILQEVAGLPLVVMPGMNVTLDKSILIVN